MVRFTCFLFCLFNIRRAVHFCLATKAMDRGSRQTRKERTAVGYEVSVCLHFCMSAVLVCPHPVCMSEPRKNVCQWLWSSCSSISLKPALNKEEEEEEEEAEEEEEEEESSLLVSTNQIVLVF